MTIYLLLSLTDDGQVTVQETRSPLPILGAVSLVDAVIVQPSDEGYDWCGYQTYEIAGYSIDVRHTEGRTTHKSVTP